ncbi:MAG: hypothetical protein QOG15_1857 [Solirubrobacteraceae bacterium]|nr:hypothetical protein [Solirubrobacteraceae bacterium]
MARIAAIERAWPALAAGASLMAILGLLGFNDGGYFPPSFIAAGAAAFITLAVVVVGVASRTTMSSNALAGLGLLAAFALWSGVSAAWSTVADVPVLDMQRSMLYVGLFGLALVAADSPRHARLLVWGMLGVTVLIVGAGLLSRLEPDLLAGSSDPFTNLAYRLGYPLEYWNAFGAMASMGGVLALGLAADRRAAAARRAVFAGTSALLLVAMYLSLSRGAWMALAVGLVVLVALAPNRGSLLVSALLVGGALAIAVLRLRSYPALVDNPAAGSGQEAQGNAFTVELVALVAGVAGLQGLLASKRVLQRVKRRARELRRPASLMVAVLLVAVAAIGYAARGHDARAWVDRQWQDFMQPTAAGTAASGTTRLFSTSGARSEAYRVAFDGFQAQPIRGEGAGSFAARWTLTRRVDLTLHDAHSLVLETLAELGLIGGLLLIGFLVAVGRGAVHSMRGRGVLSPAPAAGVAAAVSVWLAHACVDWDWQMPALTGIALVLAAALTQRRRRRRPRSRRVHAAA